MDAAVRTRGEWTDEDDARLRQLIEEHLSYAQIGELVGRSKGSCIGRAHRLGIHNSKTKPSPKKKVAEAVSKAVSVLFPPRPAQPSSAALRAAGGQHDGIREASHADAARAASMPLASVWRASGDAVLRSRPRDDDAAILCRASPRRVAAVA